MYSPDQNIEVYKNNDAYRNLFKIKSHSDNTSTCLEFGSSNSTMETPEQYVTSVQGYVNNAALMSLPLCFNTCPTLKYIPHFVIKLPYSLIKLINFVILAPICNKNFPTILWCITKRGEGERSPLPSSKTEIKCPNFLKKYLGYVHL